MSKYISAYEALAKSFSKKKGIQVICKGSSFLTDGETIIIPEIPDSLNAQLRDPALAGILHESQHVVHSKFKKITERTKEEKKFSGLINNIEDIRIYKLGVQEYPGYQDLQETGLKFIRDNIIIPELRSHPMPKTEIPTFLGGCLQYRASGVNDDFFPENIRAIADIVEEEIKDVKWLPRKEGENQSTEITQRIVKKLKELIEEPKEKTPDKYQEEKKEKEQQRTNGKTDGEKLQNISEETEDLEEKENSDSEEGENNNPLEEEELELDEILEEEEEGEDSEENDSNGEGESPSSENKEPSNSESKDDDESSSKPKNLDELEETIEELLKGEDEELQDESSPTSLMSLLEDFLSKIIRDHNVENDKHIPYPPVLPLDREVHIKDKNPYTKGNREEIERMQGKFLKIKDGIDKQTRILKAKLLPLLLAEKRSSYLFEQPDGILDEARIFRIPNGDQKIYKQKVPGRKLDTAISILCDVSGSMHHEKIEMLKRTLLVLADSLQSLKVPFEILSFTTGGEEGEGYTKEEERLLQTLYDSYISRTFNVYNRFEPLLHTVIKSFNENYFSVRELIPLITSRNNNIDGEAVDWALKRLSEQRESRKILFVLSDGQPAARTSNSYLLIEDLKEKVKKGEKAGIEIIGIGMLTDAPKKFYTNHIQINELEEISTKIYQTLLNKLKN